MLLVWYFIDFNVELWKRFLRTCPFNKQTYKIYKSVFHFCQDMIKAIEVDSSCTSQLLVSKNCKDLSISMLISCHRYFNDIQFPYYIFGHFSFLACSRNGEVPAQAWQRSSRHGFHTGMWRKYRLLATLAAAALQAKWDALVWARFVLVPHLEHFLSLSQVNVKEQGRLLRQVVMFDEHLFWVDLIIR